LSPTTQFGPPIAPKHLNQLKKLTSSLILKIPDLKKPFIVFTNASGYAIGAILAQDLERKEHPVYYASRKLTPAESRYSITELECLAALFAAKIFYLYLAFQRFTVVTDHRPLGWLMAAKDISARLTRWSLKLQACSFNIVYRPGKVHQNVDYLSRSSIAPSALGCSAPSSTSVDVTMNTNLRRYLLQNILPKKQRIKMKS